MAKTQNSGIYKLPNTDWYSDDVSVMVDDIFESDAIDEIGLPQDIIDRYYNTNDTNEIGDWIEEHVVQLLEPIN